MAVPIRDTPPADLLVCPQVARAFPTDAAATIPDPIRSALRALLLDYRDLRALHLRLVNWTAPHTCPEEPAP